MSTVVYNGVSYSIPAVGDSAWGTSVTSYLTALATGSLTKAGGAFTLTADANFGSTYGLISTYYKTSSSNLSSVGNFRLGKNDTINWRNNANSADLELSTTSTDRLQFNGVILATLGSATFPDNVFKISGSSDATKLAAFEVDGFTTATTRTFTLPNATTTLVGTDVSQTLTNKTLSGNTAATLISGSGTLTLNTSGTVTLPNATDTLVGKATTDTLTNKTLTGNTAVNLISGSGTLTLNTSGTITVPNATDTLVGKATTDTLSNKTLTSPTINSPTLTTPVLGTPSSGTLTSCDGLPIVAGTTGTLSIARGGTGQITANAALNALLPSQASANGKVLSSNGTDTSWASALTSTLTSANIFVGNVSNVATAVAMSGDVTIDNAGVSQIGALKVTAGMLAGSIPYSKLTLTGAILNADLAGSITGAKLVVTTDGSAVTPVSTGAQTLAGAKTWNDVQTFKAVGGTIAAGSYSTTGAFTLGPSAGQVQHFVNGRITLGTDTTGSGASVIRGNGATATVATNGSTNFTMGSGTGGLVIVQDSTNHNTAVFAMNSSNTPVLIADPASAFSITSGTGSKTNVFYGGSSGTITVQNKTAGSVDYLVTFLIM